MRLVKTFLLWAMLFGTIAAQAYPPVPVAGLTLPTQIERQGTLGDSQWEQFQLVVQQAIPLVAELFPENEQNIFRWNTGRRNLERRELRIVLTDQSEIDFKKGLPPAPYRDYPSHMFGNVYRTAESLRQDFVLAIQAGPWIFTKHGKLRPDATARVAAQLSSELWGYLDFSLKRSVEEWMDEFARNRQQSELAVLRHAVEQQYFAMAGFAVRGERTRLQFRTQLFRSVLDLYARANRVLQDYVGPFRVAHRLRQGTSGPNGLSPELNEELSELWAFSFFLADRVRDPKVTAFPTAWDSVSPLFAPPPGSQIVFSFADSQDPLARRNLSDIPSGVDRDPLLRSESFMTSTSVNDVPWRADLIVWTDRVLYQGTERTLDPHRLAKLTVSLAANLAFVSRGALGFSEDTHHPTSKGWGIDLLPVMGNRISWLQSAVDFVDRLEQQKDVWDALTKEEQAGFIKERELYAAILKDCRTLLALAKQNGLQ